MIYIDNKNMSTIGSKYTYLPLSSACFFTDNSAVPLSVDSAINIRKYVHICGNLYSYYIHI